MNWVVSPRNTWNFTFVFDGRSNPDLLPQQIRISSIYDNDQNMVQNLTLCLASHFYPSPTQLNVSYIYAERNQSSDFSLALDSKEIKARVIKHGRQSLFFNATTQRIPLEMNCQCSADLTNEEKTAIQIQNCSMHHPYLTTSLLLMNVSGYYKSLIDNKLNITVTNSSSKIVAAVTDIRQGRGQSRIYCGQEDDIHSPCNVTWSFDGEQMMVKARVNTSAVNHTTNVTLSGLSSFDILGWSANLNTSTLVVSNLTCSRCHNCTTSLRKYQFDVVVRDNKLNLTRVFLNSTQWPMIRAPGSLYLHYISNATAYLDILASVDIKKRIKLETGMYQGINQPSHKLHVKDALPSDYLEMYYFQLLECQKNMTLISKDLYNQSEIQQRQLVKMDTKIRSNYWPISCNEDWQQLFAQIFPQTPITPFCAKDVEMRITYDKKKQKEFKVELDRQQSPVLKVVYNQEDQKHKLRAVCQGERNPSCNFTAVIGGKELSLNTSLNLTGFEHKANISLSIRPNVQNEETLDFQMVSKNAIIASKQPVTLNTTIRYTHENGLYVRSKMNATKDLDNLIHVERGVVRKLRLYGKSISILSEPRSWDVSYVNTTSAFEIVAHVLLGQKSQIKCAYYEGQNRQNASLYEPQQQPDRYIQGFLWNYTACNQQSLLKFTNVLSQKGGKRLVLQSSANIDMWPFIKERRFLYTPSCLMCLGELQYNALINTTDDVKLDLEVLLAKTSLLSMNYTIGNNTQRPGYYLLGKTEIIQDVLQESSPRMLLSTNATILSGQDCLVNVTVERKGYALVNFKVKEHFNYGPNEDWRQHLSLNSSILSIFFAVEKEKNMTVLGLK